MRIKINITDVFLLVVAWAVTIAAMFLSYGLDFLSRCRLLLVTPRIHAVLGGICGFVIFLVFLCWCSEDSDLMEARDNRRRAQEGMIPTRILTPKEVKEIDAKKQEDWLKTQKPEIEGYRKILRQAIAKSGGK